MTKMHEGVASFLSHPVGNGVRREQRREPEGEDSMLDPSGGFRAPERPIVQVWHLLLAIASIMAILLAAHYAFIMASVRAVIQDHEISTTRETQILEDRGLQNMKRIDVLESRNANDDARALQLRHDLEDLQRQIGIIRERQEQVRARLRLDYHNE